MILKTQLKVLVAGRKDRHRICFIFDTAQEKEEATIQTSNKKSTKILTISLKYRLLDQFEIARRPRCKRRVHPLNEQKEEGGQSRRLERVPFVIAVQGDRVTSLCCRRFKKCLQAAIAPVPGR